MIEINVKKDLLTTNGSIEAHYKLSIELKEFITLFGPSGAGKTTLLRLIAGLEKPKSGTIIVNDEIWFDSTKKINLTPQQRSIGFVFQDYALFPNMSVRENLLYAATSSEQKEDVDTLIELVELLELAHRYPDTLSGGQKQRVALARALVRKPKILLLDEPLSALDHTMRLKLQDELQNIYKKFGMTILLVSHDIAESFKLSTKIASVENGNIIKIGKPEHFFTSQKLSGKLQLIGEVISIDQDFPTAIVTFLIGMSIVKVVLSIEEASTLTLGRKALLSTKAFNPLVIPL